MLPPRPVVQVHAYPVAGCQPGVSSTATTVALSSTGEGVSHRNRSLARCACGHGCAVGSEYDAGSSTAAKSPSRQAARKASTSSRRRAGSVSDPGAAPTRWLASCLAAAGERPTRGAISSKGEQFVQDEREALDGASVSKTTSSARTDRVGRTSRLPTRTTVVCSSAGERARRGHAVSGAGGVRYRS